MSRFINLVSMLLFMGCVFDSEGATVSEEYKLVEHLLSSSSRQVRPVTHWNMTINATFGIELIQLIHVDDRNQFMKTKIWVRQSWKNYLMKWDPEKWGNLPSVQVDASLLWVPDIVLYNNGDEDFTGGTEKYKTRVKIASDGTSYWNAPATFVTSCKINIRYFPFDRQICILKFGSWTYNKAGISILKDNRLMVTSQYVNSSEWDVVHTEKVLNTILYGCCPVPFVDITFKITMLRKPSYFVWNVITPCLLLIATILFGFFLPPESGERIALTITLLLAFVVFLQLISMTLPRNYDSVPILTIFYITIMMESSLSLVTTCIVLWAHSNSLKGAVEMPNWVRRFFLHTVAKLLCIRPSKSLPHPPSKYVGDKHSERREDIEVKESYINNGECLKNRNRYESSSSLLESKKTSVGSGDTLDAILNELGTITSTISNQHHDVLLQEEWKLLGRVLDRLFFWLFLLTAIVCSTSILIPAYFIYY